MKEIGTEFWYEFPYLESDNRGQSRFLYKVVAHDETVNGLCERIEPIRHQTRSCISFEKCEKGYVHPIFGEWKEEEK